MKFPLIIDILDLSPLKKHYIGTKASMCHYTMKSEPLKSVGYNDELAQHQSTANLHIHIEVVILVLWNYEHMKARVVLL